MLTTTVQGISDWYVIGQPTLHWNNNVPLLLHEWICCLAGIAVIAIFSSRHSIQSQWLWHAILSVWEVLIQFWDISQCCFSPSKSTSGGQTHNLEAAIQWTVHLERSTFICFSALMVHTHHTLTPSHMPHIPHLHTLLHIHYAHSYTKHSPILALWKWSHTPENISISAPALHHTLGHISPNSPRNSGKYPPDSSETWPTILSCSRGPQRNVPCE